MTVLVTGGTGFLGSAVVRHLLARGRDVRVLARAGGDRRNITGLPVEILEGDLRDSEARKRALQGVRDLFHVAADYRLWVQDEPSMYAVNVDATAALMRAALDAGVSRIVYTSSVATLAAASNGKPADEATPVSFDDMIGPYKRSKFLAERAVLDLHRDEGLPVVIVNPSFPIGPRDVKPTPSGRMVVEAAAGRMPAFVATGLNAVHVDDVAHGHLLALEHGRTGERYILGGENFALQQILAMIADLVGRKPPRVELPASFVLVVAHATEALARLMPRWEPFVTVTGVKLARKNMFFSSAKAERELGYRPRHEAKEALADAIDWFRANKYL